MSSPLGPFPVERADVVVAGKWREERRRAVDESPVALPTEAFTTPTTPGGGGLLEGILPRAPYIDAFLAHHAAALDAAGGDRMEFGDWDHTVHGAVGIDVESFPNFFVICLKRFSDGKRLAFERSERGDFDTALLEFVLRDNVLVSFNGKNYDLPMVYSALEGADPGRLKAISDQIILNKSRDVVRVPWLNHIDLMEPNPSVRQGLKILQGRLHCRFLVDLPFPPGTHLTREQMNIVTLYCFNDIDGAQTLYETLREPLKLRSALGRTLGMDLKSKSDAQIGEIIVVRRVEKVSGTRATKGAAVPTDFRYVPPDYLKFSGNQMSSVLAQLREAKFNVIAGKIVPPEFLKRLPVSIGGANYTMGIGGIHSTESYRAIKADGDHLLLDVDVASQYPNIILGLGLYPASLGPAFLDVYRDLVRERLAAKAIGDTVRAEGGKIALNGVFGKLGSPYSPIYSPDLFIAVTLTGQLAILMLIELVERARIPAVSANTDGIVFHCPRAREEELNAIISEWESGAGFSVDRTRYAALYSSCVNMYIAVREDGKVKRRGAIANPWAEGDLRRMMMKNPQMTVCSDAVVRLVTEGVPVEDTIDVCRDPRAFLTVIKVTGGAVWRGHALGRAVRYYWSTDGDEIQYADANRRVAKTEGARPLMELTDALPADVDFPRYHREARNLAADLGINRGG